MTAAVWSVNRQAAKAVALSIADRGEARHVLDMLGLIDGPDGRQVLPDDRRVIAAFELFNAPSPKASSGDDPRVPMPAPLRDALVPAGLRGSPTPSPPPEVPMPTTEAPAKGTRQGTGSIQHGTPRGYWAERSRKQQPCEACKTAISKYTAEKKADRQRKKQLAADQVTTFNPGFGPLTTDNPEPPGVERPVAREAQPAAPPALPPELPAGKPGDPEWILTSARYAVDPRVRRAAAQALIAWLQYRVASEDLADTIGVPA